ncbi:MAG: ABC transporter permease [Candidatus Omnitrophica bacterium]|nr:ABC transporter permease [Candidatus Omnitrophota bacterium]
MNLRRVSAICKKEFIQIWRDPRSLALGLGIPIILIVIFGFGLSLDIQNVPIAIWDRDNTKASVDFILNFRNSKYFEITSYHDNYEDLVYLIDRSEILMAMVIPKQFSRMLDTNQLVPVQLILDGSDSNTATVARGYVKSVVAAYNTNILVEVSKTAGIVNVEPIDLRSRVWFNQDFQSKYFIIPGLIALIMMTIAALLTSLTVAREWERGTMEQLISTPVRPAELVVGKFIPYFVIGMIDLTVAVLMGRFVFMVPLRGSVILLFVLSAIFLAGSLGVGITISIITKNQLLASQMSILISFLPTALLSGFTYEIFNMPKAIQWITYLVPARYFIICLRGIYLKAVGLRVLWAQALLLSIFAVFMVSVAIQRFRKKII